MTPCSPARHRRPRSASGATRHRGAPLRGRDCAKRPARSGAGQRTAAPRADAANDGAGRNRTVTKASRSSSPRPGLQDRARLHVSLDAQRAGQRLKGLPNLLARRRKERPQRASRHLAVRSPSLPRRQIDPGLSKTFRRHSSRRRLRGGALPEDVDQPPDQGLDQQPEPAEGQGGAGARWPKGVQSAGTIDGVGIAGRRRPAATRHGLGMVQNGSRWRQPPGAPPSSPATRSRRPRGRSAATGRTHRARPRPRVNQESGAPDGQDITLAVVLSLVLLPRLETGVASYPSARG